MQGLSTLAPPTAAAAPSSSSRAKGEAKSFKMQRLSDPQTKELAALFEFLDTDNDGLLGLAQATALCRQLGFNVDLDFGRQFGGAEVTVCQIAATWLSLMFFKVWGCVSFPFAC